MNALDISGRQLSYLLFVAPIAARISDYSDFTKAKRLRQRSVSPWGISIFRDFHWYSRSSAWMCRYVEIIFWLDLIGQFPLISTYPAFRRVFGFILQGLGASVWCRHGWRFEAKQITQAFWNSINLDGWSKPGNAMGPKIYQQNSVSPWFIQDENSIDLIHRLLPSSTNFMTRNLCDVGSLGVLLAVLVRGCCTWLVEQNAE